MRTRGIAAIALAAAGTVLAPPRFASAGPELGPYGPPFGAKADVVRSFTLETTGAVARAVSGKKGDGKTGLRGQCDPKMFANFGIERGNVMDDRASIYIVSKGRIGTGATGEFKLDTVSVVFYDDDNGERKFNGPGTLTITTHQAGAGSRRMAGTIRGPKLEGVDAQKGKVIDATATFELEFSCGIQ
jgi:hypothetical protein